MSAFQFNNAQTRGLVAQAQAALVKPDSSLEQALDNSASQGLPPIAISPSQGHFLSILCQLVNAKSILEIGTLGGYSTLFFAKSRSDVQVTSLEVDSHHRDVALQNLKGQNNVNVILGSALDTLPQLEGKQTFDFVFIDADWPRQKDYFDWAVKLTRPGGCIYVDNAVRAITEASSDGSDEPALALVDRVKDDERVHATLIPTVNSYHQSAEPVIDGFLIAFRK